MNIFDYGTIKDSQSSFWTEKQPTKTEEEQACDFAQQLISSLSLTPKKQSDPKVFVRAISSIIQMKKEGIIDEDEANELFQFIASKFVENSFNEMFELAFDKDYSTTYSIKGNAGSLKLGRFKHD